MKVIKGQVSLDGLDRKLIQKLQVNGQKTNVALAKELTISESTVRRRIERLQREGVIKIVAVPNLRKIGWG